MLIFKKHAELADFLSQFSKSDIGFTPTMGALHKGHLSLVQQSSQTCKVSVVSIYINPTQFNSPEDFNKYPYTPDKDIALLQQTACDVLYLPDTAEVYGSSLPVNEHYALGYIETTLEGAFRPGHFQGVCMVVRRLLERVKPGKMFLGLKDYQQVMVLKRLTELIHLDVEVIGCKTLREDTGLALSSRNLRLTDAQRQRSAIISETLSWVTMHYTFENQSNLCQEAVLRINRVPDMNTEYFEMRNAHTLMPLTGHDEQAIALAAAFCGNVRLIDNMFMPAPKLNNGE